MNQEQNMKRKLRALALVLAPALIFAACDSPTNEAKGSGEVIYTVGVNGEVINTSDLIQGVKDALQQSIESNNANGKDGKSATTPMDVSFSGGDLRLSDEAAMYKLYEAIEDYYVNLDLRGVSGSQFMYFVSHENVGQAGIVSLTLSDRVNTIKDSINVPVTSTSSSSNGSFNEFTGLKRITAPRVTSVGSYAFSGCTALTTVDMPNAETLGTGAFFGCSSLTTISLPKVKTIGTSAFNGCSSLTSLEIPEVNNIGSFVFNTSSQGVPLTITMGATPPILSTRLFHPNANVPAVATAVRSVTILLPAGVATYSSDWIEGFQGKGWNGRAVIGTDQNTDITVTIENQVVTEPGV